MARKGEKLPEEVRQKIRESLTGRKLSQELRQKLSEVRTGRIVSDATREKIRIAHLGKPWSEERKAAYREPLLRKKARRLAAISPIEVRIKDSTNIFGVINPFCADLEQCWSWVGKRHPEGYGLITFEERQWRAHRLVWKLLYGDPGKLLVCHLCDNPSCVRPSHLFLGTAKDNNHDRAFKGRNAPRTLSEAWRAAVVRANTGKKHTNETRENMRQAHLGMFRVRKLKHVGLQPYVNVMRMIRKHEIGLARPKKSGVKRKHKMVFTSAHLSSERELVPVCVPLMNVDGLQLLRKVVKPSLTLISNTSRERTS